METVYDIMSYLSLVPCAGYAYYLVVSVKRVLCKKEFKREMIFAIILAIMYAIKGVIAIIIEKDFVNQFLLVVVWLVCLVLDWKLYNRASN